MEDARKEKAVKDILTILDGFRADEINEILFKAQGFCNINYVFDLKSAKEPARCCYSDISSGSEAVRGE